MISSEYKTIVSQNDGVKLDVLTIKPDTPIKGILQLAHGMSEYKQRYIPLMEYLANKGYLCVINDHRGHGKSVEKYDDLGYFYAGGGKAVIDDLYHITKEVKSEYPDVPYYLFGHSMGSMAVRAYCKKYDDELSGLIVCGSPSYNPAAGVGSFVVNFLSKIKGERYKSEFCENLFVNTFNKNFKNEGSNFAWLSENKDNVAKYESDEMCGFSFTLNGYKALLYQMKEAYSKDGWAVNNPKMPIHFISGEYDPCMTNMKAFLSAVKHMKSVGYENVSYKVYENMRHEILQENKKDDVISDIGNLLDMWSENK